MCGGEGDSEDLAVRLVQRNNKALAATITGRGAEKDHGSRPVSNGWLLAVRAFNQMSHAMERNRRVGRGLDSIRKGADERMVFVDSGLRPVLPSQCFPHKRHPTR
jgi:hypothetical protein